MKVRIPKTHYEFYRRVYHYLHHTLGEDIDRYPNWELSKTLIGNYIKKHREGSHPEEHLLATESTEPSPPTTQDGAIDKLEDLHKKISSCQDCFLGKLRKKYVKLPPSPPLPIMVVVDIPSFYDQTQGYYFKDEAGKLLKKILMSLNIDAGDIYHTAAIKCSYSQEITNRLSDALICEKYLLQEIKIIKPKLILGFGKTTYDLLMGDEDDIKSQRFIDSQDFDAHAGKILSYHGIDILFTHHPRDMIINPILKKSTWQDLKKFLPLINKVKE